MNNDQPDPVRAIGCLLIAAMLGAAWGLAIGLGVLVYRLVVR